MIPDKIYIHIGSHLGLMQATAIPVGTPDENEYISKDVLLEWLKQNKQEMEQDLKGSDGLIRAMIATAISSFQEVIEKLESL